MFNINDYAMHRLYGVLVVKGFEDMEFSGVVNKYYVCEALYGHNKGVTIKIPINRSDESLSRIISKQEADKIIDSFPNLKIHWEKESKRRVDRYNEILKESNILEICTELKSCYHQREVDKITAKDREFVEEAEKIVFGEFAISLNIPYDDVIEYIRNRLE